MSLMWFLVVYLPHAFGVITHRTIFNLKTLGWEVYQTKNNMCDTCSSNKSSIPVLSALPVLNQSSGDFEKLILSVNHALNGTQFRADGYTVAPSVVINSDGDKVLVVTVKVVTFPDDGFYPIAKSLQQTVILTKAQLVAAGCTPETIIVVGASLDGTVQEPTEHVNGKCWTTCICDYRSGYWHCLCTTICDDGRRLVQQISV